MKKPNKGILDYTFFAFINKGSVWLIVVIFPVISLLLFVLMRPLNHDETYYLISSDSFLFGGKVPYKDFVFHQVPLILFTYMPATFFDIYSVLAGRIVSCTLFSISFLLLWEVAFKKTVKKGIVVFALLFFANFYLINWAVTIKIYSMSFFLLAAGTYYFNKFLENEQGITGLIIATVSFSFLIFTKIIFVFNFAVFFIFAISALKKKYKIKKIFQLVCMMIIIPIIIAVFFGVLFRPGFDILYFDLYGINTIYLTFTKFIEDIPHFFLFFLYPQNFIILLLATYSFRRITALNVFIACNIIIFIIVSFFSRLLAEYLVSFLPLMILLAYSGYCQLLVDFKKNTNSKYLHIIPAFILVFYVLVSPISIDHFKQYIQSGKLPLNPLELIDFTRKIDQLKGYTVISSWEGLTAYSNKKTYFKENYAVSYVNDVIDDETKKKFNLITKSDYKDMINKKIPDIIVFDKSNGAHLSESIDIILYNYEESFEYNNIQVFIKKQ